MVEDSSIIKVPPRINSPHQLNPFIKTNLNTAFSEGRDPLRMIQNRKDTKRPRDLRLVIHGSSGGVVHPLLNFLVEQVKSFRGSSVELEILTDERVQESTSSSIWLIPLLLLPGNHSRNDIPRIYNRLRSKGIEINLLPFLGSWPEWLSILKNLIDIESNFGKPVLLHHPLSGKNGSIYLDYLNKQLNIPIIDWEKWHQRKKELDKIYSPIPYSLAPNKNTKSLRKNDSISSLLEIEFIFLSLTNILVQIP